jgi:hypothetical protein
MHLPKPSEGGNYTPAPAGTHTAICIGFIDLGTQTSDYMGEKKTRREVVIMWELVGELMENGQPFTTSKRYTWSMNEKASLRHHLEAWRGRAFTDADFEGEGAFDTRNLLGKPCTLTIQTETSQGGKSYSKVASVGAKLKGVQVDPPVNPLTYISLEPELFDPEAIGKLSNYWREKIGASPEYQSCMRQNDQSRPQPGGYEHLNDDIPFWGATNDRSRLHLGWRSSGSDLRRECEAGQFSPCRRHALCRRRRGAAQHGDASWLLRPRA